MTNRNFYLSLFCIAFSCNFAAAQAPGTIYTWNGTGDLRGWVETTGNGAINNNQAGFLTLVEGDPLDPLTNPGGQQVVRDDFGRRLESSLDNGGLDLTGLTYLEFEISHNSPTATVPVQFFAQVSSGYTFVSGGSDGMLGRSPTFSPDWQIGPGLQTIRFPVNQLTEAEQAYIPAIGLDIRQHTAVGNLTWQISELRSVGPPLTTRIVASHNAGTSENGFNGAYINFEETSVKNNNGAGAGQVGLAVNAGALEWTDLAGGGGAAISWGNGTSFGGNNYNERPASFDNYNKITFRVKATDPLNLGGTVGAQSYFQNENYASYQVAGNQDLPIDGQYHDLTFPINAITGLRSVDAYGLNFGMHTNEIVISVDEVKFSFAAGVQGDYNNNGVVDAADYVLWRNGGPLQNQVDDPNAINAADYDAWRARFGNVSGSGAVAQGSAVPEPTSTLLLLVGLAGLFSRWITK